jgi:hypothetical protein
MNDAITPGGEGKVTMGLDRGERHTQLCMIAADGELLEEARLRTTPAALRRRFAALPVARLVLEAGTHSPWVSRLLEDCGHEVLRGQSAQAAPGVPERLQDLRSAASRPSGPRPGTKPLFRGFSPGQNLRKA